MQKQLKQSQGTVSITAAKDGRHEYCFSNQMSSIADKIVRYVSPPRGTGRKDIDCFRYSFNVHGVIYVDEDGQSLYSIQLTLTTECSWIGVVEIVAPIEREIRLLANGLTAVKDEQEYIVVRERTHRNTAESTNSRVKWWSIMQTLVLFSVVAWQIYYLKVRCDRLSLVERTHS